MVGISLSSIFTLESFLHDGLYQFLYFLKRQLLLRTFFHDNLEERET